MNEKYMISRNDITSVIQDGVGNGFTIKMKIPYYRGVSLSLVDYIEIRFNDQLFTKDDLRLSVDNENYYDFTEISTMHTTRWEYGEKATVFVPMKGGMPLGRHRLEITVGIRISYLGGVHPTTVVLEKISPMGG